MNINNKTISITFIVILAVTVAVSAIGMLLMSRQPMVLQGQIEATEIRISGKLPGRIDSFLVEEGKWVKAGDTLVVINSPVIEAKYRQVNALEQVAQEQNKRLTPVHDGRLSPQPDSYGTKRKATSLLPKPPISVSSPSTRTVSSPRSARMK